MIRKRTMWERKVPSILFFKDRTLGYCDYLTICTEDEDWIENIGKATGNHAYEKLVEKMGVFRWQSAHGFRTGQERGLSQLKPKYANIKEEALHNSFSRLSKENWNRTLLKAKIFCQCFAGKNIRTLHHGYHQDHITGVAQEWGRGTKITLQEIVTLKLYTDFDQVQYELKRYLRWETMSTVIDKKDFEEQQKREELKRRLEEFFHWKAGLQIVLNKFGIKFRDQNECWHIYHGVTAKMILNPGTVLCMSVVRELFLYMLCILTQLIPWLFPDRSRPQHHFTWRSHFPLQKEWS